MRSMFFALALLPASVFSATNSVGLKLDNFDPSVSACQNFYQYANGNWLKRNPVPEIQASWGTFNELEERNNERLKAIAAAASTNPSAKAGTPEQQVGAYYAAMMNEAAIEKAGLDPINDELAAIERVRKTRDIAALVTRWHAQGMPVLFSLGVRQDLKNPERVIAYAGQGGLGLPNRDYYLNDDAESVKMRTAYVAHVARILELGGSKKARAVADAKAILALETGFAKAALKREEMRDPNRSYNVITVAAANKATPEFSWRAYFDGLGLQRVEDFSFSHPQFFAEMNRALNDEPSATWRAWLRWNLLRTTSPYLSQALSDENFAFYNRTLRGQQAQKPRDIRAIEQMNGFLGEPLGQLFVAQHFPPEAKARMMVLIGNLKASLKVRLEALPWMSEETRQQAIEKWSTFTPKIGYPDRWRDFSSVVIKADDHFGNVKRLLAFEQAFDLAKVGKPADRSEWGMPPQQVNAYYNAVWNEIVFPAGILQPPFFDLNADDALNYGAIGAVIGHELLHGFDDSGSRFDAKGRLNMWWTQDDRAKFDARANKLVTQAGEFSPLPDLRLNGRVSLGENIADLGGVQVAYDALQRALETGQRDKIDGFTPEQRFFLSWAQVWRRNFTEAALRVQINVGPHAPGPFRTNGPLSNLPAFAQAFSCKAGDPMVRDPAKRVEIW